MRRRHGCAKGFTPLMQDYATYMPPFPDRNAKMSEASWHVWNLR
jgi:hypothetical protein